MPAIHRHGDLRACRATTIVVGQGSVFVNSKLWSVDGDPNSHGSGELYPSHNGVFVNGKPVIVNTPDPARTDNFPHWPDVTKTAQGSPDSYCY